MENGVINSIINDSDEQIKEEFLQQKKSNVKIDTDLQSVSLDISWLEKVEEAIPYMDNLVRNPKKFIMQEEEIVGIEKARKITSESIKHLGTHTNFIQDYDPVTDTVTPNKILNINKEESYDIYEDRFFNTLVQNLLLFISQRKKSASGGAFTHYQRTMGYTGETTINNEKIKYNMSMDTDSYENLIAKDQSGLGLTERIEKIEMILNDFTKSELLKSLQGTQPVRSPIRKTNAILKNPNFQKCLEIWEMIETFDLADKQEVKEKKEIEPTDDDKENFDMAFYLNYMLLNNACDKQAQVESKVSTYYVKKIIEDFVDKNTEMDERTFKKMLEEEFSEAYKNKQLKFTDIESKFNKSIEKYNKMHNYLYKFYDQA